MLHLDINVLVLSSLVYTERHRKCIKAVMTNPEVSQGIVTET